MIYYENIWQLTGSVFPNAAKVAFPSAAVTLALNLLLYLDVIPDVDWLGMEGSVFHDSAAWTGFSTLVGFLVVFRTSQAYSRFWDGCTATYMMRTEWFDACSSVVAFCKYSKASEETILAFQNILIRLFSMLHALALAEIEDSVSEETAAFNYELIDIEAIDTDSLRALKSSECKVELVFQWIQQLLVENIDTGVLNIPAPILSRAFQELATGMVQFHDALKISSIPFPFPYAQTCDCLLLIHSFGTPFVMCQWVSKPWWAFVLSFTQVFILWCLNYIAVEIQNPFGSDANDIDAAAMQNSMNSQLLLLLNPATKRTPRLKSRAVVQLQASDEPETERSTGKKLSKKSFSTVFTDIDHHSSDAGVSRNSIGRTSDRFVRALSAEEIEQIKKPEEEEGMTGQSIFGVLGGDDDDLEPDDGDTDWEDRPAAKTLRTSLRCQQVDLLDCSGGAGWHSTMRRLMEAKGVEPESVGRTAEGGGTDSASLKSIGKAGESSSDDNDRSAV